MMVDAKYPGVITIRKARKDGTVWEGRYHRKSKTRLWGTPGTLAFDAEYERACRGGGRMQAALVASMGRSKPRMTFIYFIQAETLGHIKIGQAIDPGKRLSDLRVGSPDKLTIMGVIRDDSGGAIEKNLHAFYAKHRLHGEWFRAAPDLVAFIESRSVGWRHIARTIRAAAKKPPADPLDVSYLIAEGA